MAVAAIVLVQTRAAAARISASRSAPVRPPPPMAALDLGTVCTMHMAEVPGMTLTGARANFEDVGPEVVKEVRDVRVYEDVVAIDAQETTDGGVVGAGLVVAKVAEGPPVAAEDLRAVRAFPIRTKVRGRAPKAALFISRAAVAASIRPTCA